MSVIVLTATTAEPCVCCANSCITGAFSCETRGGVASLCGYSEYVSPSTPPKKYRTQTQTGDYTYRTFVGADCTGAFNGIGQCSWEGTCGVDPDTCVPFIDGTQTCYDGFETHTGIVCGIDFAHFSTEIGLTPFETPTSRGLTTNGICFSGNNGKFTSANFSETLTDEDTEADAIARLFAGAGGIWSGCTGTPCCLAEREERTTGFSLSIREARWTITATGLLPDTNYSAIVEYWRRPYGAGSYVLYQTDTNSGVTDGSGNFNITGNVPNEIGFQTYAVQGTCPP